MSLFQIVYVRLVCQRCDKLHATIVQFYSDLTYVAEYELMEIIPRRDGLSIGEVWEGVADRYCEKCSFQWAATRASAAYDSLAELIERGLVTARAKGESAPLPASTVIDYGEKYPNEFADDFADGGAFELPMPFFEEFDLVVGDKPVGVGGENWIEFLDVLGPLIAGRMRNGDWLEEGCMLEDFRVRLDPERRIIVEDMQGQRLLRDGTRRA
jgi:hypothetical protein